MKKVICNNCREHIFNTYLTFTHGEIKKSHFILVNKDLYHPDKIICPLCGEFFLTKDFKILTDKGII